MKRLTIWLRRMAGVLLGILLVLATTLWMLPAAAAAAPEASAVGLCRAAGPPIDLNNANMMAFQDCPGFYPHLAKLIVSHGPYQRVEDVLKIEDLTAAQKDLLTGNLEAFTVTDVVVPLEQRMPPRLSLPAH